MLLSQTCHGHFISVSLLGFYMLFSLIAIKHSHNTIVSLLVFLSLLCPHKHNDRYVCLQHVSELGDDPRLHSSGGRTTHRLDRLRKAYEISLATTGSVRLETQCIVAVPGGSCNTPYFETFSKGVLVKTTDFKHKEGVL
jgi:hypothetical protein